jgi:hypothetical protein
MLLIHLNQRGNPLNPELTLDHPSTLTLALTPCSVAQGVGIARTLVVALRG